MLGPHLSHAAGRRQASLGTPVPRMLTEAEEQVRIIRENLKTAQSRQKSQYDHSHKEVACEIGDKAYLRVTPEGVLD